MGPPAAAAELGEVLEAAWRGAVPQGGQQRLVTLLSRMAGREPRAVRRRCWLLGAGGAGGGGGAGRLGTKAHVQLARELPDGPWTVREYGKVLVDKGNRELPVAVRPVKEGRVLGAGGGADPAPLLQRGGLAKVRGVTWEGDEVDFLDFLGAEDVKGGGVDPGHRQEVVVTAGVYTAFQGGSGQGQKGKPLSPDLSLLEVKAVVPEGAQAAAARLIEAIKTAAVEGVGVVAAAAT